MLSHDFGDRLELDRDGVEIELHDVRQDRGVGFAMVVVEQPVDLVRHGVGGPEDGVGKGDAGR